MTPNTKHVEEIVKFIAEYKGQIVEVTDTEDKLAYIGWHFGQELVVSKVSLSNIKAELESGEQLTPEQYRSMVVNVS